MSHLILTDIDDTLLLCSDALELFIEAKLGFPAVERIRDAFCFQRAFALADHEGADLVQQFWRDPAFLDLPPEPCAREVMPLLYRGGYRFVAITACPDWEGMAEARAQNLSKALGVPFEAVHCTGHHGDKRPFLSRYEPSLWVEDNWKNAVLGAEIGHQSVILTRGYNAGLDAPGVARVKDWHDIAEMALPDYLPHALRLPDVEHIVALTMARFADQIAEMPTDQSAAIITVQVMTACQFKANPAEVRSVVQRRLGAGF